MINIYKTKYKAPFLFAIFLISLLIAGLSAAGDSVPIPKKRPVVLSVSPAYIKDLLAREAAKQRETKAAILTPPPIIDKPAAKISNKKTVFNNTETFTSKIKVSPHKIEPSAKASIEPTFETTLVSFALEAGQVSLDKNLEEFLEQHAIAEFSTNTGLKMEIHSYATAIKGQKHSEVRISLARALEVRSFLIGKGIAPNRLTLSPMKPDDSGNPDRIDLIFIESTK